MRNGAGVVAGARLLKTLQAVGWGNDIRFGVQKSHSGWWLENGFRIILGFKRTDTVASSTEQIADMFQLQSSSSSSTSFS